MSARVLLSPGIHTKTVRALMLAFAGMVWCPLIAPASASATATREIDGRDGFRRVVSDTPDPAGWEVRSSEFADLWYGTLATVGLFGFGPMPLYDAGYARSARARKDDAGVYPTALDRAAGTLLRALRGDDAFEVLHFVPVYFAEATVEEALAALRAIAVLPPGTPVALPGRGQFGATVVASVLTTAAQRVVLGDLLRVMDEERRIHGAVGSTADRVQANRVLEIEALWNREVMPRLAEYARTRGLETGLLIVTPALDREGRFFTGDPSNPLDNVVVIGVGPETRPPEAVSAMVREICYPVVRAAMASVELDQVDRREASRASDRAATRCGAILLAELAPDARVEYERYFGVDAHLSGSEPGLESAPDARRFTELERELDALMRRDIQRR